MLMSIALKDVVDRLLMGPTDFSQWGMRARHIDVFLCLRVSTEFATGSICFEVSVSSL